jgi:hypothetical protein
MSWLLGGKPSSSEWRAGWALLLLATSACLPAQSEPAVVDVPAAGHTPEMPAEKDPCVELRATVWAQIDADSPIMVAALTKARTGTPDPVADGHALSARIERLHAAIVKLREANDCPATKRRRECVAENLLQLQVAAAAARERNQALAEASTKGDSESPNHQVVMLATLHGRAFDLAAAAMKCRE